MRQSLRLLARSANVWIRRAFTYPLACASCLFLGLALPTADAQAPPARKRISDSVLNMIHSHHDITFARYGDRKLQLDLFRPRQRDDRLPEIICIHGGGWWKGERGDHEELAQALAAKGFVTVTISYRLSAEQPFPAQINDAKAAVRWLRANATTYGVKADAIGAIGHSAGGHLTALLATSGGIKQLEGVGGNEEQSSSIQAAVAIGAQSDFEATHIRNNFRYPDKLAMLWTPFLGGAYRDVPKRYHAASPASYLDSGDQPLAFIAGETDHVSTRADDTRRRLMGLGVPTGLTIIPGTGHGVFQKQVWFDQVVNTSAAFFQLHLDERSAPSVVCDVPGIFSKDSRWQLLGNGYAGCEGAQWNGDRLHFAAHHDRFAFTWTTADGLKVWRDDSPEATSFRPDGDGGYYVVEQSTRQLARWDANGRRVEVLSNQYQGKRLNRPNDCVIHPDGSVWFTDPDYLFKQRPEEIKELDGQFIFRYDPLDGSLSKVTSQLNKPNGIAFSPDGKSLFVTDSATNDLYKWPVGSKGQLGQREVFATLPDKGNDGLAFDPQGRLWCCAKEGIVILNESGECVAFIRTPNQPTSIAFAPAPSRKVCVTTRDACYITELSARNAGE